MTQELSHADCQPSRRGGCQHGDPLCPRTQAPQVRNPIQESLHDFAVLLGGYAAALLGGTPNREVTEESVRFWEQDRRLRDMVQNLWNEGNAWGYERAKAESREHAEARREALTAEWTLVIDGDPRMDGTNERREVGRFRSLAEARKALGIITGTMRLPSDEVRIERRLVGPWEAVDV